MQRRPWPLVLLAILQFFTPLMSLIVSAYLNHVSLPIITRVIWNGSDWIGRFQFFGAPILVGLLIFWARLWGFFLVVIYGLVVSYFNIQEWRAADQPISIVTLVLVNAFALALVAYLCIPKVRAIFFNSKLRWWETKPRYIVNLSGEVRALHRDDDLGRTMPCTVMDLSAGGGGMDTPQEYPGGTQVEISFQFEQDLFKLTGIIVYGRMLATSFRFGTEWTPRSAEEKLKYKELIAYFKRHKFPETRKPPEWRSDLKSWLDRAAKSPGAWVPEVNLPRPAAPKPVDSAAPVAGVSPKSE